MILGGPGNDLIREGASADTSNGDPGADTFQFLRNDAGAGAGPTAIA